LTYYTRKTPDYSPLVVHFTKEPDRALVMDKLVVDTHPLFAYKKTNAKERLLSILMNKIIYASPMPFLPKNSEAVCFTECIWDALINLADRYSPYGIVFSKRLIFENGGGPALYMRGDSLSTIQSNMPSCLEPLVVPFDPDGILAHGVPLNWVHEREWRLPKALGFEYSDIQYVIVATIQDAFDVIQRVGPQDIPEENYIPMDVYRTIRKAWKE
jgi:hypothetical protein